MKNKKRKYVKRDCKKWGHNFVQPGVDNRMADGGRMRYCTQCKKHFIYHCEGILDEELADLMNATLVGVPYRLGVNG